ncbi:MAG: hydantoinase/oxoprolinase family protein, partial [Chitinophagaceae bacterium]
VVERKGVKTALITTRGFRDVYEIGRSNRPDAYNLFFERPVPLAPRSLRREVMERMTARGEIHTPLNRAEAAAVVAELKNAGVEAIAVCLLHSYANPAHEEALGEIIASVYPQTYVTLSHHIMREYREYERTSTTAVNAYVGPVVARYLGSLQERLGRQGFTGEVLVMQSGGGVMSLERAIRMPVRMGLMSKRYCIFISDTDANTIGNKLHDDAVPDLDVVGTCVSVERSILPEHWSIWQLKDHRDNGTCPARQTATYCGLA